VFRLRGILPGLAAVSAAVGLAACGGAASSNTTVARVGDRPISRATLSHWMKVVSGGRTISDPAGASDSALRREAFGLVVSAYWLLEEAEARHLGITPSETHAQIAQIEGTSFPGGAPELREFLEASGESLADLELRAKAQVAAAKLRQASLDAVAPVTSPEVAAYYARHKHEFLIPERRVAKFRNWKTKPAAERAKREVEAGMDLTSPKQRKVGELSTSARVPPGDEYEAAIDSATPYHVSGPYKLRADWWLYQVIKVTPPRQQSLAEVRGAIAKKLLDERTSAAVASLERELTSTWTARTDCKAGYVVQKCKQYSGPRKAEEPLTVQ
jgi:foldase protein PrsA